MMRFDGNFLDLIQIRGMVSGGNEFLQRYQILQLRNDKLEEMQLGSKFSLIIR